jgi:gluconolactonase
MRSLMSAAWAVFVVDAAGIGWLIRLPEVYANVAFGGPKRDRLFMTASQSLYVWQVNIQGAALG